MAVHIPSQQDQESDSDIEEVRQVLKRKISECSGGVGYNLYCDVQGARLIEKDLERTRTCNDGGAREVSEGRRALKTIHR